jgi:hypothetical protein
VHLQDLELQGQGTDHEQLSMTADISVLTSLTGPASSDPEQLWLGDGAARIVPALPRLMNLSPQRNIIAGSGEGVRASATALRSLDLPNNRGALSAPQ